MQGIAYLLAGGLSSFQFARVFQLRPVRIVGIAQLARRKLQGVSTLPLVAQVLPLASDEAYTQSHEAHEVHSVC